jgi:molybdopterin/thiamine biosynthesis adenylyltransferase
MNYTIDPFVIVSAGEGRCQFIGADTAGTTDVLEFAFLDAQMELVKRLLAGEFLPENRIRSVLTDEITDTLISHAMLVTKRVDTVSIDSRTRAFYRMHGMAGAENSLHEKSVLILGAGGIGTHMSWHMTLLGVGHMTIVDFDTVEESNLNRQLLFDRDDIGKLKVPVLVEKLQKIRPDADIRGVDCRIDSMEALEAICTERHFDLIVKALDSPSSFPLWLDAISKKHRLPYVAGITIGTNALIGPTFLPDTSEIGWSDILPLSDAKEKIGGTAPSIGMMLYHIADALAVESFKLLTGKGTLQYLGCISVENLFTGQQQLLRAGGTVFSRGQAHEIEAEQSRFILPEIFAVILMGAGAIFYPVLFIPGFVYCIVAPFLVLSSKLVRTRMAFVNTAVIGILFLAAVLLRIVTEGLTITQAIPFILIGFLALSICLIVACSVAAIKDPAA